MKKKCKFLGLPNVELLELSIELNGVGYPLELENEMKNKCKFLGFLNVEFKGTQHRTHGVGYPLELENINKK